MRVVALALVALFTVPPVSFGAESMYGNDPRRELKEDIEDVYGMYILNPSRRHPKERVELSGDNAEFWLYYDPRKLDGDELKCDAIRWLVLGRFGKGGAQPFFAQFPKINAVELDMFQLNSTRTVDASGKYTVSKSPRTILKVKLTRRKADKIDWATAKETLEKLDKMPDAGQCVKAAEKFIDAKWYNREYFR